MCQADEQAVFHHPRYRREPGGQPLWVGDSSKRGIDDPVTAIRDKSKAFFVTPQRQCATRADRRKRTRNGTLGGG